MLIKYNDHVENISLIVNNVITIMASLYKVYFYFFLQLETKFILTKTSYVDILNTILLEASGASYSVSSLRVSNTDTLPVTIDDTIPTNFGDLQVGLHYNNVMCLIS